MDRSEQYEIWGQTEVPGRWDLLAAFFDFELARAVAGARTSRVRLIRVTYEEGKPAEREVLAEVGNIRSEP